MVGDLLLGCFSEESPRLISPLQEDLKKVTDDHIELYTPDLPPEKILMLLAPIDVSDAVPEDSKINLAVRKLENGKSPGPSKLRAEQLKKWLEEATREEEPQTENWDRITTLVKLCFEKQSIPTQFSRSMVVLLLKDIGNYRGIGLLEIVWKTTELIINWQIAQTITFFP